MLRFNDSEYSEALEISLRASVHMVNELARCLAAGNRMEDAIEFIWIPPFTEEFQQEWTPQVISARSQGWLHGNGNRPRTELLNGIVASVERKKATSAAHEQSSSQPS